MLEKIKFLINKFGIVKFSIGLILLCLLIHSYLYKNGLLISVDELKALFHFDLIDFIIEMLAMFVLLWLVFIRGCALILICCCLGMIVDFSIVKVLNFIVLKLKKRFSALEGFDVKRSSFREAVSFVIKFPLLIYLFLYYFSWEEYPYFTDAKVMARYANFQYSKFVIWGIDRTPLYDTQIASVARKCFLNNYKSLKKNFYGEYKRYFDEMDGNENFLQIAGFYEIDSELRYYSLKLKKRKKLPESVKNRYEEYKSAYLLELKNVLEYYPEYYYNNDKTMMKKHNWDVKRFVFMGERELGESFNFAAINRLVLYPKLAASYIYYAGDEASNQDLNVIFENFFITYNQEKENYESSDFENIKRDVIDSKDFENFMSMFWYQYSRRFILDEKQENPEMLCKNTKLFDYYLISTKLVHWYDEIVPNIISNECKYKNDTIMYSGYSIIDHIEQMNK